MNQLRVTVSEEHGKCVVEVVGDVDSASCAQLREELIALIDGGANQIILDLAKVNLLDSAGRTVLVGARKRLAPRDGSIVLRSPTRPVRKVLQITGLDRVFTVVG